MTEKTMKPLVYYCRWHTAKLRIRDRDSHSMWGDLVLLEEDNRLVPFHYDLVTWVLILEEDGVQKQMKLDAMGVTVATDDGESGSVTTSDVQL